MTLPLQMPLAPMEAEPVEVLPEGEAWQYEPKWDGFRCLVFHDGAETALQSKAGQPLARYFPELTAALGALGPRQFVVDGEIVIPVDDALSFEELLQRIHPAQSRVQRLAREHPALLIAFDLLVGSRGQSLFDKPLRQRRAALEHFAAKYFVADRRVLLSPATRDPATAQGWLASRGIGLDGIVAKRLDLPYRAGARDGMQKVKPARTADCVVGGFRYAAAGHVVGSLLLGLYDEQGLLDHVGFTSALRGEERRRLTARLEALVEPPGFTGRAPGGPSRWSRGRSGEFQPLRPELVVEVDYDHFSGGRFRHGTRLVRWRPDKAPRQCTFDQIPRSSEAPLRLLVREQH